MTETTPAESPPDPHADDRAPSPQRLARVQREADALRKNMRRRKDQARIRLETGDTPPAEEPLSRFNAPLRYI